MKQRTKPAPVKVHWNFVPRPVPPKMKTFKNGHSIIAHVAHGPRAESDGHKILRVYCYGCGEYFSSYHHYLWRHGECKTKPPKGVH